MCGTCMLGGGGTVREALWKKNIHVDVKKMSLIHLSSMLVIFVKRKKYVSKMGSARAPSLVTLRKRDIYMWLW